MLRPATWQSPVRTCHCEEGESPTWQSQLTGNPPFTTEHRKRRTVTNMSHSHLHGHLPWVQVPGSASESARIFDFLCGLGGLCGSEFLSDVNLVKPWIFCYEPFTMKLLNSTSMALPGRPGFTVNPAAPSVWVEF